MNRRKQFKLSMLRSKMLRIRNEIDATLDYLTNLELDGGEGMRCEKCHWRNLRIRTDGSYFCSSCGYDNRKLKKQIKEKK